MTLFPALMLPMAGRLFHFFPLYFLPGVLHMRYLVFDLIGLQTINSTTYTDQREIGKNSRQGIHVQGS